MDIVHFLHEMHSSELSDKSTTCMGLRENLKQLRPHKARYSIMVLFPIKFDNQKEMFLLLHVLK